MYAKNTLTALSGAIVLSLFSATALAETGAPAGSSEGSSVNQLQEQQLSPGDAASSESGKDTETIRMGFKRLDADDDGTISMSEARGQIQLIADFKRVDVNGDQKVNMEEYAQFAEANSDTILNQERNAPRGNLSGEPETPDQPLRSPLTDKD